MQQKLHEHLILSTFWNNIIIKQSKSKTKYMRKMKGEKNGPEHV